MRARQLSGWHLTTLIMAFAAVIAVAAVALMFGTEAVIGIVVAIVIGDRAGVLVPERLNCGRLATHRRRCVSKEPDRLAHGRHRRHA